MRQLIAVSLAIALLLSACGSDSQETGTDESTVVAATAAPTADTVEPTSTAEPTAPTSPTHTPVPTVPSSATPVPSPTTTPTPTADFLDGLTYPSSHSDTGSMTLSDGAWESEPIAGGVTTTKTQLFLAAVGALNADVEPDAAVVLRIDPGGSGTFFDLYAVDGATNAVIGPVYLGDRIRELEIPR